MEIVYHTLLMSRITSTYEETIKAVMLTRLTPDNNNSTMPAKTGKLQDAFEKWRHLPMSAVFAARRSCSFYSGICHPINRKRFWSQLNHPIGNRYTICVNGERIDHMGELPNEHIPIPTYPQTEGS